MLEMNRVQASYPGFELDMKLSIPDGQITALVGPNGSGKTTLIKSILSLTRSKKEGTLFGKEIDQLKDQEKEKIGVVFADSGFSEVLNLHQVKKILQGVYRNFDPVFFDQLLREFELDPEKRILTLSNGQKNLLRLAAALTHQAVFLILDEPTNGLDILMRQRILNLLQDYVERYHASILITSHIASDLEHLSDEIVLIKNGKVLFKEKMYRITEDYALIKSDGTPLDEYIIAREKTPYGMRYLSDQKQFYRENYPDLIIENVNLEDLEVIFFQGETK